MGPGSHRLNIFQSGILAVQYVFPCDRDDIGLLCRNIFCLLIWGGGKVFLYLIFYLKRCLDVNLETIDKFITVLFLE